MLVAASGWHHTDRTEGLIFKCTGVHCRWGNAADFGQEPTTVLEPKWLRTIEGSVVNLGLRASKSCTPRMQLARTCSTRHAVKLGYKVAFAGAASRNMRL